MHGQSLVPSFHDADVPEFRATQYFEMIGNRGIYHKGWTACTRHAVPWILTGTFPALDDDVWELYAPEDWSQSHDLASELPDKLAELQRLWLIEAVRYNVLPIDDRKAERFNPEIAGRPELLHGNTQMLYSGMRGLGENLVLNMQVRMEFAYDGGGLAKGGTVSLYIDGEKTGEGRIDRTQPMVFSLDDKTDVGSDRGTPVSDDYRSSDSAFNGQLKWIQLDIGQDAQDADHLITPDERFHLAVAMK